MTGAQHAHLMRFLFPGDGSEAVAFALCGRRNGDRRHRLLVRTIEEIPYGLCIERSPVRVRWSTDVLQALLERAARENLSVIKIHSHPTGFASFSATDDTGDSRLLPMIRGWIGTDVVHGSAVMLPDGQMFGRIWNGSGSMVPMAMINAVGDDLHFWYPDMNGVLPSFVASHAQIFDDGTIERLQRLSIAVVGASGTGSPTVEQLIRLGVGEIVLVDDDRMEDRNVNRILNSTMQDVRDGRLKVDVLADAVARVDLGTHVIKIAKNLWNPDVIRAVAQCDIVFGCMDSIDGRYLLNTLATYYTQAYFDIGVRLVATTEGPKKGRIQEVCGTIHCLQPGRSSLMSRGLFTMQDVAKAGLRRNDPAAHAQQVLDGYIAGMPPHRPAVISVNMLGSSLAINELLARLHPFREEPNSAYVSVTFSLASMELINESKESVCPILSGKVGCGDAEPLLGLIDLAQDRAA
jgi:hypothetical protein